MILLILISGAYFYISGIITSYFHDSKDDIFTLVGIFVVSILWLPILSIIILIGLYQLIVPRVKTLFNDYKNKFSRQSGIL